MVDIAELYGVSFFKTYCDEYLSTMAVTTDNIFKLMDLADKYLMTQLKASVYDYITKNFQTFVDLDGFANAKKDFVKALVTDFKDKVKPELFIQAVYNWCENRATDKIAADSTIILNDEIKSEMSDFLPHINFDKMELKFLHEYVVARGFIFPNLYDLSKILSHRHSAIPSQYKVKVTNAYGQILYGNIISDETIIPNIVYLHQSTESNKNTLGEIWWEAIFNNIPTTPSPLKKRENVEWYLVCYRDGDIGVTRSSVMHEKNYLLAEMTAFGGDFQATRNCKFEIE